LCFSILGFLQSISPFVRSADEENVLASFFGGLLSEQVFVSEKLFDARELALIAEMHSDVMSMPPDQVVVAVDYVKKHILKGEAYRTEKVPIVALELRKFLTANGEEKQRALQELAAESKDRLEATRREMMRERTLREEYENRLQKAHDELDQSRSDAEVQKAENANMKQKSLADDARFRRLIKTGACVLAAYVIRQFDSQIVNCFAGIKARPWLQREQFELGIGLIRTGFLLFPLLWFIPRNKIKGDARTALVVTIIILWFWVNGIQSSKIVADLSAVATVGLYLVLFLRKKD